MLNDRNRGVAGQDVSSFALAFTIVLVPTSDFATGTFAAATRDLFPGSSTTGFEERPTDTMQVTPSAMDQDNATTSAQGPTGHLFGVATSSSPSSTPLAPPDQGRNQAWIKPAAIGGSIGVGAIIVWVVLICIYRRKEWKKSKEVTEILPWLNKKPTTKRAASSESGLF